ncbi:carboxylesterase [Lysobacteraceae bacterium NML08-0793]|nr:carboxylesterase [Xanthomonadaceae bacterium NML08-0793]
MSGYGLSSFARVINVSIPDCIERETGQQPQWAVIWLHGLGADAHDFEPIVPELIGQDWPALRFVFPNAPVRPITINGGVPMRGWYDIRDMDLSNRADAEGVAESVVQIEALIAREIERGIPAERIFLAGFSQGGAITLAAGIERTTPLAGLVALSTYLPLGMGSMTKLTDAARQQPVFMAHGLHDPVVPYGGGRRSRDMLRDAGFEVDWHAYPMMHQVCAEEIRDLGHWFEQRFSASP